MRIVLALAGLCLGLAAAAADPAKVLRVALENAESTFDPALFQDTYSSTVAGEILEPMLRYDYLARPARLVPNTLASMPEVSADGLTLTFRIQPGIHYTPDPAFGGARRELVAADYAYSILRFYDPRVKSPNHYLVDGKIQSALDQRITKIFSDDARREAVAAALTRALDQVAQQQNATFKGFKEILAVRVTNGQLAIDYVPKS